MDHEEDFCKTDLLCDQKWMLIEKTLSCFQKY